MPGGDWITAGVALAASLSDQYVLRHYWQQILDMQIATRAGRLASGLLLLQLP